MSKRALTASCIAVMTASCAPAAGPWVRGYVVAFYDFAFRYGGRADYSRGAEIEPGIDCPYGSTTHFAIPAQVAKTFPLVRWRTPKERRGSITSCTGPGDAMRPGAETTATARSYCGLTTRCSRACTPSLSGS